MARKNVALFVETSNSYARGVLEGIAAYVRQHERWSIFLPEQERGSRPPQWLQRWRGDGVIARIETDAIAAAMRQVPFPVVDVSAARHLPDIPWVETDDEAIASLGIHHLTDRGFHHVAFCGDPGFNWSNWRKQYFSETARKMGLKHFTFDSLSRHDANYSWDREKRGLAKWLQSLPKPIGILACYDIQAQKIVEVCRELDIAVPEEAAVLGVDNDVLLCELADPPISSILCNTRRTGFEAAALLDRMMNGERIEATPVLIEPQGIHTRQSTDILAINDPEVANALRFIRENALNGINVKDILSAVPVSRRVLESRFRKTLGRTPHQEIARVKANRIQELLRESELSLFEIAKRTGFEHEEYMTVFFRRATGIPPGKYRRLHGQQQPKA